MTFPAQHGGSVKRRAWYKVRWVRDPPGLRVAGTFDLLMDTVLEQYKEYVQVVRKIETRQCEAGLPLGFGKSEAEVDAWIRENGRP